MKVLLAFLLLASILIVASASSSDLNYYDYALQKCSSSSPWTIHGLWPQWGVCCSGPAFSMSAISSIEDQMNKYWPSCPQYGTSNEELWSHEWQKHGTCSGMTELAYFQQALNLLSIGDEHCSSGTSCSVCFAKNFSYVSYSHCQTNQTYPDC